jgi:glycosyltransferase involved in cell wall biosynthesis
MGPKVSVILPCRNEEKTIGICIKKIQEVLEENKINGEIIVADSSSDRSAKIAKNLGGNVVKHNKIGYGNAYLEGFKHAKGKYIIMGDADDTYDFLEIPRFLEALKDCDFVIGDRFKGNMEKGAMPWLHKYIGNPFLSFVLRVLFKTNIRDAHCGFRAIKKKHLDKLNLVSPGMEFASEMIIKAIKNNLKIKEIPVNYSKRIGKSKLQSFNDGWQHLRFMLLYSPNYLFLLPGIILFIIGLVLMIILVKGPFYMGETMIDIHSMVLGSLLSIVGFQITFLGLFAKTYAVTHQLNKEDKIMSSLFKHVDLKRGLSIGAGILLIGFLINLDILIAWILSGFSNLGKIRIIIFGSTIMIVGLQVIFSSFFLSILGIEK